MALTTLDGVMVKQPTIPTAALINLCVTTAKIADANVTTAKLADANVTFAKLASDAIGFAKETITQAAHGFTAGKWLKWTGGAFALGQATTGNSEYVGVVESATTNTFVIVYAGRVSGLSGLTANTEYYGDASTPGAITSTAPSAAGNVQRTLLIATSTTSGIVRISPIGIVK